MEDFDAICASTVAPIAYPDAVAASCHENEGADIPHSGADAKGARGAAELR
jgi:hypothetical protein